MDQTGWQFVHILLFVFWLGADVGVWLAMLFVRDASLAFPARVALVRLAFLIDLAPRFAFALMIPVGTELARGIGAVPQTVVLRLAAWGLGLGWCVLHALVLVRKGTALAGLLRRLNVAFEAAAGLGLVGFAAAGLGGLIDAAGMPDWLAVKLLLFGLVFLVVLGIDTRFQPFTMLLATAPQGPSPAQQAQIRRATDRTLAWALLLYALIVAIAWLGKFKPV